VLSLVIALWFGYLSVSWVQVLRYAIEILTSGYSGGNNGSVFLLIAMGVGVILVSLLSLIGAIQLFRHRGSGRTMIAIASILGIAYNALVLVGIYGAMKALTSFGDTVGGGTSFGADTKSEVTRIALLAYGLPLVVELIIFILVLTPSTSRWCQRAMPAQYTY
jgi:hypothetical protein